MYPNETINETELLNMVLLILNHPATWVFGVIIGSVLASWLLAYQLKTSGLDWRHVDNTGARWTSIVSFLFFWTALLLGLSVVTDKLEMTRTAVALTSGFSMLLGLAPAVALLTAASHYRNARLENARIESAKSAFDESFDPMAEATHEVRWVQLVLWGVAIISALSAPVFPALVVFLVVFAVLAFFYFFRNDLSLQDFVRCILAGSKLRMLLPTRPRIEHEDKVYDLIRGIGLLETNAMLDEKMVVLRNTELARMVRNGQVTKTPEQ
jgi:hypothetical protein